ncbi:hypothetical protein AB0945_07550 [Streptomyces sp. NPDC005474]
MTVVGPAGPLPPPEVFGGFGGGVPDALGLAQPGTTATGGAQRGADRGG